MHITSCSQTLFRTSFFKGWSLVYAQYLRLQLGLVTPHIAEMSVAHCVAPYTTEKSQSHRVTEFFSVQSRGHSRI